MSHRRQHGNQKAESRLAAMRRIAGPRDSQLATRNSRRATRGVAADRRGILLLVVLSMLVLFLLVGTSFVVSSNQYRKANKTLGKPYAPAKSPLQHADLLEEVVNQLVRDTTNEFSSLRYHSLLRDLYGADGFSFELPDPNVSFAPNTGGQFIRIDMQFSTTPPLSQINGYYNGLVWTMADGSASGQSVRIVNYRYLPFIDTYRFELMRPEHFSGLPEDFAAGGDRVVINGRPFNGTGVGYNADPTLPANAPKLSAFENVFDVASDVFLPRQIALMPNAAFFDPNNVTSLNYGTQWMGRGGADESYDAPDFQNMALAWSPVNPIETLMPSLEPPSSPDPLIFSRDNLPPALGKVVLPSFHRPALINYWANQGTLQTEPNLLRKIMLRPNWHDHPNFTGSNPEYADAISAANLATNPTDPLLRMVYGPWDVDNDNDGRRDSVWVDFGAPVMMSPQGKLVKPLAAILCVDMDGRLNLNAHGSMADIVKPFFNLDVAGDPSYTDNNNDTFFESDALPQGQGYGPAEISLEPVVGDRYRRILQGVRANNEFDLDAQDNEFDRAWSGRYGHRLTVPTPGFLDSYDLLAQLKQQGLPQWANFGATLLERLGNYATPPDLKGRYSVGLNALGQPVYEAAIDTMNLDQDSPYELDLSRVGPNAAGDSAKDGPFSLAEMERILRAYDRDAGKLPARLWELANRFRTTTFSVLPDIEELNEWRALMTTDSFDLPVPSVVLPEWMRNGPDRLPNTADDFTAVMGGQPVNLNFVDLITYRVLQANGLTATPANIASIQGILSQLIAPELADGLRLDLNRPFGNGRDDNNNGVVDEPGEIEGAYWNVQTGRLYIDKDGNDKCDVGEGDPAVNSTTAISDFVNAPMFDNIDRDGDGMIAAWERGDADGGGLSFGERVNLHNFRRQLFARHLYVLAMALVDPLPDTSSQENREKRARQLAQWAINVADFRDPDNIMTAFEYDLEPFNGWGVDGNVADTFGPDGIQDNSDDDTIAEREFVWGCERPDLLMTEVLAWHDRRTQDSANEEPYPVTDKATTVEDSQQPDADFDQLYRPRGAAFIELYNPWPAETAANADTHALDADGNDLGCDLTAVGSIADPNNPAGPPIQSPVWRIKIYRNTRNTRPQDGRGQNIKMRLEHLVQLDPDDPDPRFPRPDVDRTVYFVTDNPSAPFPIDPDYLEQMDAHDGSEFYSTFNVPPVRPGRYMIIGSGEDLDDDGTFEAAVGDLNPEQGGMDLRRIELIPGNLETPMRVVNPPTYTEATPFIPPMVPPKLFSAFDLQANRSMCDVALINRAVVREIGSGFLDVRGGEPRRFTLSEPPDGYPDRIPGRGSKWTTEDEGAPVAEGWYAYGDEPGRPYPLDIPLDDDVDRGIPLDPDLATIGTKEAYRWLFLQRLANPLLAWNPEPFLKDGITPNPRHNTKLPVNPYMTIDISSANLSVFNGRNLSETKNGVDMPNGEARGEFSSVERGWNNDPAELGVVGITKRWAPATTADDNPWNIENIGLRPNDNPGDSTHFMASMPKNTIGFLNEPFQNPGEPDPDRKLVIPNRPFPWFTWNNRPFVSGAEIMQVPTVRSSQLLRAYSMNDDGSTKESYKGATTELANGIEVDGPYGHLPNFFRQDAGNTGSEGIAGLYRVLEYVGVPSRYVGTETWLNPAWFSGDPISVDDPRYQRQPPFNKISAYRDPGRVNLNTIVDHRVWDGGILHRELFDPNSPWNPTPGANLNNYLLDSGHLGPVTVEGDELNMFRPDFVASRRGYVGDVTLNPLPPLPSPTDSALLLDRNMPTFFANPFRSSNSGFLVPLDQLRREDVDSGFLRSNKVPEITIPDPSDPLNPNKRILNPDVLGQDPTDVRRINTELQASGSPLMAAEIMAPALDTSRNAYFRYQPMTRMKELTTTRSNVYAVWITIGFFEVEEAPDISVFEAINDPMGNLTLAELNALYQRVYPEGYQLGREMGSDTGEFERLREFAIVDRSIPVAFEPGVDHNVERAVRLRRRIE